jgi:hypothetical protein
MSATVDELLDQVLGPLTDSLTTESAQRILQFRLDAETEKRINVLAEKANEGTLSDVERAEYAGFVDTIDLVGVVQAKVRDAMARQVR